MPLSSDPKKRAQQLAVLAEGRRVAKERRAQGLPTKRTELAGSSDAPRRSRVVKGGYPAAPAKQPASPAAKPAPPDQPTKGEPDGQTTQEPERRGRDWLGIAGRIVS